MTYLKAPADKYVLGFCNACTSNCHNDCGTQTGCAYNPDICGGKKN
jgi:Cys-rich peptide (Clo7bot family)